MKTIFLTFVFFSVTFGQTSNCLSYEPTIVKIRGIVERDTFPGRPNYESIKDGEEPEVYWILKLQKAICVNGNDINESESDVTELQLVFLNPDEAYKQYKRYVGHKVVVTGTLFHSISAHHKTRVLITVNKIVAG